MSLTQNLQGALQFAEGIPRNALAWLANPEAQAQATWGRFSQGLSRYQQLLEASGDPTRSPQTPAQSAARDQLTRLMTGLVGPQAVGMLAGPAAATADLGDLARAYALHGEGALPQDIWAQTGWALPRHTPDARPRFEIPDNNAQVDIKRLQQLGPMDTVNLSDVFQHPELLRAYPRLAKVQVGALPADSSSLGQFNPRTSTLRLDTEMPSYARTTMLHELQHAVQGIEATSPGGAPSMFEPMHLDDLRRIQQLNDQLGQLPPDSPEASALRSERDEIFADTATPVEEHAARVNRMLKQHQQEAQTYVEHANRGHPEARRYVDEAVQRYQQRVPSLAQTLRPKELQEQATAQRLASENPRFVKAMSALVKAQRRLSPLEQYKRLGGEAEARMTEYRSQLRPDTLRQLYPYDPGVFKLQTGVPLAELIHLPGSRNALGSYLRGTR